MTMMPMIPVCLNQVSASGTSPQSNQGSFPSTNQSATNTTDACPDQCAFGTAMMYSMIIPSRVTLLCFGI